MSQNKSITSLNQDLRTARANSEFIQKSHLKSQDEYHKLYESSINDGENFWLEQAQKLAWGQFPTQALNYNWDTQNRKIDHTWFQDGTLNVTVNCLDRHLHTKTSEKIAFIWQGDQDEDVRKITYGELHEMVCQFSNVLLKKGIQKGDRVCIYMPMVIESIVAMLAVARIGAIHSVVFAGFSADALSARINDSECRLIITSDVGFRGGKIIPLKKIVDQALENSPSVEGAIVYQRGDGQVDMKSDRDSWWHDEIKQVDINHEAEMMNAEDPLFILYTSGSTGKPKGVLHTSAGYLLYSMLTHHYVFDIQPDDIYWCTADIGWITGHSYMVYGPLANGCTSLIFEGVPTYPDAGRFWQIVEKHKATILYTAPTAIRALMREGISWPEKYDLTSLRLLGSVGEPINPEAWEWYYKNIGLENCPIVDTWWQTETGGILITPLAGAHLLKAGSANKPFFGIEPIILRDDGSECDPNEGGKLCIKKPWPSMLRTTWGDHDRFIDTYFSMFNDVYFTGDGCRVDEDGDYWLMGRIDDVVNVSGHRIGTAEVESALVSHQSVAEAAVVPMPHEIKGQGLYAFVTLKDGENISDQLKASLINHVRDQIGPIAKPDQVQFAPSMPKTRSGKIMRRILRKIAEKDTDNLGDISTLIDPSVVESLIKEAY